MLRRRILFALGAALFAAAPAFCALTAVPNPADFGAVDPAAAPFTRAVTVTNTGTADAVVEAVDLPDPGTANEFTLGAVTDSLGNPLILPYLLAPGASFGFDVHFTPSSPTPGTAYTGAAQVTYDGASFLVVDLSGSVAFTGVLTAVPNPADFGAVDPAAAPFTRSVTVTNTGAADAVVGAVDLPDPGTANEFTLGAVTDSLGNPLTLPHVLAPGASFDFDVHFTPSGSTPGTAYTGVAQVTYNSASFLFVDLSGSVAAGGGGGGGGTTEPGLPDNNDGLFIGPCFLDALLF